MKENSEVDQFWKWFVAAVSRSEFKVESEDFITVLDARVRDLNPEVSWEIGPGAVKEWQLVISPNLDRHLLPTSRSIVSRAPVLDNWEFYAARQPKSWDYKFQLGRDNGEFLDIDVSSWTFVLLRYPNGTHEVLLSGKDLPSLNSDERWQAAAITLESILGEDVLLDKVVDFEFVDGIESRFAEGGRPIQQLRDAFLEIAGGQGHKSAVRMKDGGPVKPF